MGMVSPVVAGQVWDAVPQNRGIAFHTRDGFGDGVGYDFVPHTFTLFSDRDGWFFPFGVVFVGPPSEVQVKFDRSFRLGFSYAIF